MQGIRCLSEGWLQGPAPHRALPGRREATNFRDRTLEDWGGDRSDYYWLQPGCVLRNAPTPIRAEHAVFRALLPDLPLLGARHTRRLLAFYNHLRFCEGLAESLSAHLNWFRDRGEALTPEDTVVLEARRQRLRAAYSSLLEPYKGRNKSASTGWWRPMTRPVPSPCLRP